LSQSNRWRAERSLVWWPRPYETLVGVAPFGLQLAEGTLTSQVEQGIRYRVQAVRSSLTLDDVIVIANSLQ